MKNFLYLVFKVLRMPIFLILLGLAGFIAPFFVPKTSFVVGINFIIIAIFLLIQFFTDRYLPWRGMQTAFFGILMLAVFFIWGYESNAWVIVMQIIGLGGALFFLLDVDEQIKNYKRLTSKSLQTLCYEPIYKKLATSRCSVDMYFAALDTVYENCVALVEERDQERLKEVKREVLQTKKEMKKLYKSYFFFPKTEIQLWRKKLNDLLGKNPKSIRRRKIEEV